jgi:hypothetical protein
MSVHDSVGSNAHAAFVEPVTQYHVNPNKRHITSQLWKRNESLSMKDGLHASIKFITGDAYLGEWRANKPHGQGTLTYRSGNKIEGIPVMVIFTVHDEPHVIISQVNFPMDFHMASERTG